MNKFQMAYAVASAQYSDFVSTTIDMTREQRRSDEFMTRRDEVFTVWNTAADALNEWALEASKTASPAIHAKLVEFMSDIVHKVTTRHQFAEIAMKLDA